MKKIFAAAFAALVLPLPAMAAGAYGYEASRPVSTVSRHDLQTRFNEDYFSAGVVGGLNFMSRGGDSRINTVLPRSGDLDTTGGQVGVDLRYYSALRLNDSGTQKLNIYGGVQFSGRFASEETNTFARYHFGAGNDTGLKTDEDYQIRLGIGVMIVKLQDLSLWGIGGLQLDGQSFEAFSDERSGGGRFETFKNEGTQIGGYFGLEMQTPLALNLFGHKDAAFVAAVTASQVEDGDVQGRSSRGIRYDFTARNDWQLGVTAGIQLRF